MRKDVLLLAALCSLPMALAIRAEARQFAPMTAPVAPAAELPPPLPVLPAVPADTPGQAARNGAAKRRKTPPPTIALGEKTESNPLGQGERGAARVEGRRSAVKAEGPKLMATLTAAASAHCAVLCPGSGVGSIRLVQVFDLIPGDPSEPWVAVTLSAKVDGYLRTVPHGTACLRTAAVAIYPACGGPPLGLALPSACVDSCSAGRIERDGEVPATVIPAGRYVLVADLCVTAEVDHMCKGHAEAVFAPDKPGVTWDSARNPLAGVPAKDFGLTVTLKAAAP